MNSTLLDVRNLTIDFSVDGKWMSAVDNVSFQVAKGEILSVVGESGCGKSVTCMALTKLLPIPPARYTNGEVVFHDDDSNFDILPLKGKKLRDIRGGKIAYIFQEPSVSLNPVFRIGDQIAEAIQLHREDVKDIDKEVVELLRRVGISDPERRVKAYPHEISGGMQQRVMIAMALASKPRLLVADEPTTALDVTIQAQILDLIKELRQETHMSVILVTHNLGIVAEMADRVVVMYAGHMVEQAPVKNLIESPLHPYARSLIEAVPKLGHGKDKLNTIPGTVPSPDAYPKGCRFSGRCAERAKMDSAFQKRCEEEIPEWKEIEPEHWCRCWLR